APDELRKAALFGKLKVRPQPPQASHLVDADRFADASDLRLAQVAEGEISLAQSPRRLACRDRSDRRHGLHPRRKIGRMTDGRVLGVPSGVNRTHDYFARVDANSDLDGRPALALEYVCVAAKLFLHCQRRVQRALGMVLMGD